MSYEPSSTEIFITRLAGRLGSNVYKDYVESMGLRGNENVLDFGSGSGNPALHLAPKLQQGGGQLTCLDISTKWMDVIKRRLKKYRNVNYVLGDITTLNLPDDSFDVVLSHFVIHDIDANFRPAVAHHLARVLKPGGKMFFREPVSLITPDELRRLMRANGLEEIEGRTVSVPMMGECYESVLQKKN